VRFTGNPEEPVLLSMRDIEVPTVLEAEYSAGNHSWTFHWSQFSGSLPSEFFFPSFLGVFSTNYSSTFSEVEVL
jgi:hypothetical protein